MFEFGWDLSKLIDDDSRNEVSLKNSQDLEDVLKYVNGFSVNKEEPHEQ